ncbi:MAG: hypothetical protein IPK32_11205 [Verrucomicrobiaceae bacterium]|nr:hypothetical protein [Verrucomicrobiaceae bacterium]
MERDKVHLDEVLCMPFYLPGNPDAASPEAAALLRKIVSKLRDLKKRMAEPAAKLAARLEELDDPKALKLRHGDEGNADDERKKWLSTWATKTAAVQEEVEPLIYDYFGLTNQERALVEDTCTIFDKSDTPGTLDTPMPTLDTLDANGLAPYADMLGSTLREWSQDQRLALTITSAVNDELGLAVVKVEQTKTSGSFRTTPLTKELSEAVRHIEGAATTGNGSLIYLRDETWWFDGPRIFIAKPALRGRWTRTAALNDSADLYAAIQQSRGA